MPHLSTFGKNYARRFRETTLFEQIFLFILEEAVDAGFIHEEILYMDSTRIKANALLVQLTSRQEVTYRKISQVDPESGYYVKTEREKQFAYSAHTVCDEHGFILDVIVTPGNVHDSRLLVPQDERIRARNFSFHGVAADAAYKTPWNAKYLMNRQLRPIFTYTRSKGKKGLFRKKEFVYDSHYDCYLCPNDQILWFNTITRDGCRKYVSTPYICENCPLLTPCTTSKQH